MVPDNREHGGNRNRQEHRHRNDSRQEDRRRNHNDESRDDEEDGTDQTEPSGTQSTVNFNQLAQAVNAVAVQVQDVKKTVTGIRSELDTTQEAVIDLDKKIKPEVQKETTQVVPMASAVTTTSAASTTTAAEKKPEPIQVLNPIQPEEKKSFIGKTWQSFKETVKLVVFTPLKLVDITLTHIKNGIDHLQKAIFGPWQKKPA